MTGLRIAVQTKCLAQPLRQALHTARQVGAEGVQIDVRQELPATDLSDTALRQLRKLLDDLNLRVSSTAFPTRRGYSEPADLGRRLDATLAAMRATSKLSARVMLVTLGPLPTPDEAGRGTLLEAMARLANEGNRVGVRLAVQASDVHPVDLRTFVDELPEGLVGVDFSPADLILSGQPPREFVEKLGPHIVHVFANDAVRGVGRTGNDVELGRGTADFPELLGALEEYDYQGWATVERRSSRRPIEDVADAVQFLRAL